MLRFVVVLLFSAGFLSILARLCFPIDTAPGEQPTTVGFLTLSVPWSTIVGACVWLLALAHAILDARHVRRRNQTAAQQS
jgi:hypothetical protein